VRILKIILVAALFAACVYVSTANAWATNFADHVLESAPQLPASDWSTVTNVPLTVGDQLSVTLSMDAAGRFYRLRKP